MFQVSEDRSYLDSVEAGDGHGILKKVKRKLLKASNERIPKKSKQILTIYNGRDGE